MELRQKQQWLHMEEEKSTQFQRAWEYGKWNETRIHSNHLHSLVYICHAILAQSRFFCFAATVRSASTLWCVKVDNSYKVIAMDQSAIRCGPILANHM